jgi:hypothetical protein
VRGHHLRRQRRNGGTVCHVKTIVADSQRPRALLTGDLGSSARQRRLVDIGECDVAAAAGERERNPAADAAGRARHHRRAACKLQHANSLHRAASAAMQA